MAARLRTIVCLAIVCAAAWAVTARAAKCPRDMISIEGKYCVDRYEFPNKAGSLPRQEESWENAAGVCEYYGKRLCTAAEWSRACGGPEGNAYPYGKVFSGNKCNGAALEIGSRSSTGVMDECAGPEGTLDMSGNVYEWVVDGQGGHALMGGSYATSDSSRLSCSSIVSAEGLKPMEIGYRCCQGPVYTPAPEPEPLKIVETEPADADEKAPDMKETAEIPAEPQIEEEKTADMQEYEPAVAEMPETASEIPAEIEPEKEKTETAEKPDSNISEELKAEIKEKLKAEIKEELRNEIMAEILEEMKSKESAAGDFEEIDRILDSLDNIAPEKQPEITEPEKEQPLIEQPQATEPQTEQPDTGQPQATEPQTEQPQTEQPETGQPQAKKLQPRDGWVPKKEYLHPADSPYVEPEIRRPGEYVEPAEQAEPAGTTEAVKETVAEETEPDSIEITAATDTADLTVALPTENYFILGTDFREYGHIVDSGTGAKVSASGIGFTFGIKLPTGRIEQTTTGFKLTDTSAGATTVRKQNVGVLHAAFPLKYVPGLNPHSRTTVGMRFYRNSVGRVSELYGERTYESSRWSFTPAVDYMRTAVRDDGLGARLDVNYHLGKNLDIMGRVNTDDFYKAIINDHLLPYTQTGLVMGCDDCNRDSASAGVKYRMKNRRADAWFMMYDIGDLDAPMAGISAEF